jgi:hypothetical protein
MPAGSDVRPLKWEDVIDLYDDGQYSAIWGRYEGNPCLGVRWNGAEGECGYPSQGGNPLWYVEPEFTTKQILLTLLDRANTETGQRRDEYVQNVLTALRQT